MKLTQICIHCNRPLSRGNSSKDHVPSRCLLRSPYPSNLSTIRICKNCNSRFSIDEEYFGAFLGLMLSDGGAPSTSGLEKLIASNHRLQDGLMDNLGIEQSDEGNKVFAQPDEAKIKRVVEKNAVGHRFLTTQEATISKPHQVSIAPLALFSTHPAGTIFYEDESWMQIQKGVYRSKTIFGANVVVRSVVWDFLATESIWFN